MNDLLLGIVVLVALWLAALLQFAVTRDRGLPESALADAARWLIVAGLFGLAVRITMLVVDGAYVRITMETMLSILALSIGCIAQAVERLSRPPGKRRHSDMMGLR